MTGNTCNTGGERGKFEAASGSCDLVKCPQQPCYPEEAVLGTERCGDENCLSIPNCVDVRCAGPGERHANRLIGGRKEGDHSAP